MLALSVVHPSLSDVHGICMHRVVHAHRISVYSHVHEVDLPWPIIATDTSLPPNPMNYAHVPLAVIVCPYMVFNLNLVESNQMPGCDIKTKLENAETIDSTTTTVSSQNWLAIIFPVAGLSMTYGTRR